MQIKNYDILILGGGPAGLTAAIYASRANLTTLVVAGNPPGGQLMWTTEVENYPGFPQGILGPDLINSMREQAIRFKSEVIDDNVVRISGDLKNGFDIITENHLEAHGKTVIVATGASAKWLEIESEQRLRGKGVSACATCDGFFFRNKVVAVVGGGDSAMEEALFLAKFATKVYCIVRNDLETMRASKYMKKRAQQEPKIEFVFNSSVSEVLGQDKVTGLKIKNTQTQSETAMSNIDGLFVAIGHKPNTEFLKDFITLGKGDYIDVTNNTLTSKEGVFVAGDVSDHRYRQAITAAGLGCMAALDAEKLLAAHE